MYIYIFKIIIIRFYHRNYVGAKVCLAQGPPSADN